MKKLFILFCIICIGLPGFAYKPIPQTKSNDYHVEIQQIIDNRYPQAIKQIYNDFIQAQLIYYKFLKNKNEAQKCLMELENYDRIIESAEFSLYYDIIELTKKYVNITNEIPATDWSADLYSYLDPYFNHNKINTNNLYKISNYAAEKEKQIQQYSLEISNYLYK